MIDVPEAQRIIDREVQPLETVEVALGDALYRTLAEPVRVDVDYPPFDRSLMDGYAVRFADTAEVPVTLKVMGRIPAGTVAQTGIGAGEAMQINTGAPIPEGADAVVRVEDTELDDAGAEVRIAVSAKAGQFITPQAAYVTSGEVVLERSTLLTPLEMGVAASCGAGRVSVYKQPRVAVMVTGDELVGVDEIPQAGQIRNSNQWILEALVQAAHAEPVSLGVVRDDRDALREAVETGQESDVLLITGGVSMGAFDFVPEVLEACEARFCFQKMAIKPGRPVIFAVMPGGTLVFALPGNPVSAFVGFELLVEPALSALQGRPGAARAMVRARLQGTVTTTGNRRSFMPARVRSDERGELVAEPLSWRGSGDPFGMATANALIVRPPQSDAAGPGDSVLIIQLHRM